MQTHRYAGAAMAGLLLIVAPAAAAGANGPATRAVRKANTTVRALLRKKVSAGSAAEKNLARQVTHQVRSFLDIDKLGKLALTDHWSKLTAAQRSEYQKLLRTLIERNYIKGLRSNLKYEVVYLGEVAKSGNRVVQTQIKTRRRGRPYTVSVDYLVRRDSGTWRAFDVLTDGIGLVENYRAQFNRIIAKNGFADLLERMRKKAKQLGG